jgi:hypothetical protein
MEQRMTPSDLIRHYQNERSRIRATWVQVLYAGALTLAHMQRINRQAANEWEAWARQMGAIRRERAR